MISPLERRYQLLLRVYPAAYRAARGDELLETLVHLGAPQQRWPSAGETLHLLQHAARVRTRHHLADRRVWADGARLAGAWALLLLAAVGLTVAWRSGLSLSAGLHRQGLRRQDMRLVAHDPALTVAVLLTAMAWPVTLALSLTGRRRAACALGFSGLLGAIGVLLADQLAFGQRPAMDLLGALAGLAVVAMPALIADAAGRSPSVLAGSPRRFTHRAIILFVVAGAVTAGRSLGAPGPWVLVGPVTGVRLSALGGVAVGGWALAALACIPLARGGGRAPAAVTIAAVIPLFAGLGYCLNSASLSARDVPVLLAQHAPLIAAAVVVGCLPLLATLLSGASSRAGRA